MLLNDDKLILQIQHGNTACANELVERYQCMGASQNKCSEKLTSLLLTAKPFGEPNQIWNDKTAFCMINRCNASVLCLFFAIIMLKLFQWGIFMSPHLQQRILGSRD